MHIHERPPGVYGSEVKRLFIFRELNFNVNYFRGAGEQAHSFRVLGSPVQTYFLILH